MKDEHSAGKSKSLKSCKAAVTGKQKIAIRIKKDNFLFTDRNYDIDSYSNGDQTYTVKVMIRCIFWILYIWR